MPQFNLRSPHQTRSRVSFERVLDAAANLLAEKGHDRFTLLDVSRRAKVSIGSIYGRVDGKKSLLRAVDQLVLARFNAEHSQLVDRARSVGRTLPELFPALVQGCGDFLMRNGPLLRALMLLSQVDPFVGVEGGKSFRDLAGKVEGLLLEHRNEIRHPHPEEAVEFAFQIAYGALARHVGIASVTGKWGQGDLGELTEGLTVMCCGFLCSEWRKTPGAVNEYRVTSTMTWHHRRRARSPEGSAVAD